MQLIATTLQELKQHIYLHLLNYLHTQQYCGKNFLSIQIIISRIGTLDIHIDNISLSFIMHLHLFVIHIFI